MVDAAAGEERRPRARRIGAVEGPSQQVVEPQRLVLHQRISGPLADRIPGATRPRLALLPVEGGELHMQLGDELEIVRQGPELCRAAELELGAVREIEWLIERVGSHPQQVSLGRSLEEEETVDDVAGI